MSDRLAWLALKSVPGVGTRLFKRLIDCYGGPATVLSASVPDLCEVSGVTPQLAARIAGYQAPDWVRAELETAEAKGYRILCLSDPDYPQLLARIPDPPPLLFVRGQLDRSVKTIAVVGSRTPTRYGLITTRALCRELAGVGIIVVSGMARGVDTAAHLGALEGKGRTVAVLGSGLERIYPGENRELADRIAQNGAVVSEFFLNASPEPQNFPIRNRIISGLTLGTVVVEAAQKSGSLITARLAGEQNREVFAVPGNIHSFKSTGTHGLLKQGAKLVETAQDIVEELSHILRVQMSDQSVRHQEMQDRLPPLSPSEKTVFDALGPYPVHIDELVRKLAMDPGKLSSILLQLELKGIAQQTPGKYFAIEMKTML